MSTSIQDSQQYSDRSVRRYERIFGADYLSTGGPDTTRDVCARLGLTPGTRVLDVGSGIGGSAFHMAQTYGAVVTGIDVLGQLVDMANRRTAERGIAGVHFVHGDILDYDLPEASFDVAYSRDALLYIADKDALFSRLHSLLAPGGRIFITDYACGSGALSKEFTDYAAEAGYHLCPVASYGATLEAAGFTDVVAEDKSAHFIAVMQQEIDRVRQMPEDPETGIDPEDRDYLIARWERKIVWCQNGDMAWGHFSGRKD